MEQGRISGLAVGAQHDQPPSPPAHVSSPNSSATRFGPQYIFVCLRRAAFIPPSWYSARVTKALCSGAEDASAAWADMAAARVGLNHDGRVSEPALIRNGTGVLCGIGHAYLAVLRRDPSQLVCAAEATISSSLWSQANEAGLQTTCEAFESGVASHALDVGPEHALHFSG